MRRFEFRSSAAGRVVSRSCVVVTMWPPFTATISAARICSIAKSPRPAMSLLTPLYAFGLIHVLSAALKCRLPPTADITILCMGTDGVDGNSKAAGAVLTPKTISRIKESAMNVKEYMDKHDSHSALKKLRSLIVTGRTGTNVNDISLICKMM